MKYSFILFLFTLIIRVADAQPTVSEQYVPEILKKKMTEMYPEAKGVYWKQPMPGFMDAFFSLNKKKCNATFQVTGAWISTDFEIDPAEFPDTAALYLSSHSDKVTRYYRSETKVKGTQYSADAKVGTDIIQFIFDKNGNFLMKGPRD